MTRAALFDAIRPFAKDQKFTQANVLLIDRLADELGVPKDGAVPMRASKRAIDLIHSMESFQPRAYKDPGSKDGLPITIGWGSTSDLAGNPIKMGAIWTPQYGNDKFAQDLERFEKGVTAALAGSPVTQGQFDAMVSLAYNIGVGAFTGSTVLRKHKAGDYAGAKAAFAMWNKNDGKVMNGLVRRRAAEAEIYAS